jgi:hypothetical protein
VSIAATSRGGAVHWNGDQPLGLTRCDGGDCARVWANIRRWQTQVRTPPFRDIAYNHGICPGCGRLHDGRGWGARSAANGTTAANTEWHAWMVMLGGPEPLTLLAKSRIHDLAAEHRDRYGRTFITYHQAVRGGGTACPGPAIIPWIRAGAPLPAPAPVPEEFDFMADPEIAKALHRQADAADRQLQVEVAREVAAIRERAGRHPDLASDAIWIRRICIDRTHSLADAAEALANR